MPLEGLQPYDATYKAMVEFTNERDENTLDELWVLEHPPVFTVGQRNCTEHLFNTGDIPVVPIDRGGHVTYHGPGQCVLYALVDLKRNKIGVRQLVTALENATCAVLKPYGIEAAPRPDAPGVYVGQDKIASLGLRIRRGCSYHGLAFNIAMDLEPFTRIRPCGLQGIRMVQVKDFVPTADHGTLRNIGHTLADHLGKLLGYSETQHLEEVTTA